MIQRLTRPLISLLLLSMAVSTWAAPALRVQYHQWQIGSDGVRQEISYTEKLYRQENALWIEREIPAAAQHEHDLHAHGGLGHKHADVVGAPLWIKRDAQGGLDVKLVDRHERRLIDIARPYYGNVGFDGQWVAAWSLVDPASLDSLAPTSVSAEGIETYELRRGEQRITLRWNPRGGYAESISARDEAGLSGRTIEASEIANPKPLPWSGLEDYLARDYSDLLD
ncbi:hypothetical protein CEK62_14035 [Alcanivorax sp. N3-2A]|nr:hypothetical protein CEK62_14035 [Alcanivorax sp. N3-2A]